MMNSINYQMISFLLSYPREELKMMLPEIKGELEDISENDVNEKLLSFIYEIEGRSLDDWMTHYIEHFDFGRLTNLYVTYLKLGEQRERGLELLKLKKYYDAHGFAVTDKELPDYLPLMLEFCAHATVETSNELLQMHAKAVAEIHGKLKEQDSFYSLLFDALFLEMESHGLEFTARETI